MSVETEFLQRFVNLKTGLHERNLELGVEMTVVEASDCAVDVVPPHIAPGQKRYIRCIRSQFIQVTDDTLFDPSSSSPAPQAIGLRFAGNAKFPGTGDQVDAYSDGNSLWWSSTRPFQNFASNVLRSVEIQWAPFGATFASGADDHVHVRILWPDGNELILNNVMLDERTQQLYGYGPSILPNDGASLWILSFFVYQIH